MATRSIGDIQKTNGQSSLEDAVSPLASHADANASGESADNNELSELGQKIFLDRYALKDMHKRTLAPGDMVIVCVDDKTGQREIGIVRSIDERAAGGAGRVEVELRDGAVVDRLSEHVSKPIETEPEQMMERVARGVAAAEGEQADEWYHKFRWLLNGWKFVPAGRILTAAGTDQQLTFYNCMPPEQEILTADGYKPIAEVNVGDFVVTHRNRLRPVLHKFERETEEPVYIIKAKKLGYDDLRVTGEHKVLAISSEWVNTHKSRDGLRLQQQPQWIPAKELKSGDFVAMPYDGTDKPASAISVSGYAEYDELWWAEINEIEKIFYSGRVLDIEVDEDHSFVSAGLVVSNCYVIPSPKDSRRGIVDTLSQMMEIMSRGGGVGINVSSLRPRHSYVKGVNGRSSGSVSWGALYSFVTGLIEQGGCVANTTYIATDKGSLCVEEVVERLEHGEILKAWTHAGWKTITDKFRNGIKPVYRLLTDAGYYVDLTGCHKVLTLTEQGLQLRELQAVKVGDTVAVLLGSRTNLPPLPLNTDIKLRNRFAANTRQVTLPNALTADLAYLVGYFTANGSILWSKTKQAGDGLRFVVPAKYPADKDGLVALIKSLFPEVEPKVYKAEGAYWAVELHSGMVQDFLQSNELLKPNSREARVPELIKRAGKVEVEAFLAGYLAGDGCFFGQPYCGTASRELRDDLRGLFLSVGIASKSQESIKRAGESEEAFTQYMLTFPGKKAQTRLLEILKGRAQRADEFTPSTEERSWVWPINLTQFYPRAAFRGAHNYASVNTSIAAVATAHARLADQVLVDEQLAVFNACVPAKVISVSPMGETETFDITVEEVHLLSAQGIYSSNSRRGALMIILNCWHPDVIEFINSKREMGKITNANISVGVTDDFMSRCREERENPGKICFELKDGTTVYLDPHEEIVFDGQVTTAEKAKMYYEQNERSGKI